MSKIYFTDIETVGTQDFDFSSIKGDFDMDELNKVCTVVINTIVESHSGGVKFTELILDFINYFTQQSLHNLKAVVGYFIAENKEILTQYLEYLINNDDGLSILHYTYKNSNKLKMFIYTP